MGYERDGRNAPPVWTARFGGFGATGVGADDGAAVGSSAAGGARDVLRATRRAVALMRSADDDGRRAHRSRDLGAYEDAWRRYHDAAQLYRIAAAPWEDLAAVRPGWLAELPTAPVWSSPDLLTAEAPDVGDGAEVISLDGPPSRRGPAAATRGRTVA